MLAWAQKVLYSAGMTTNSSPETLPSDVMRNKLGDYTEGVRAGAWKRIVAAAVSGSGILADLLSDGQPSWLSGAGGITILYLAQRRAKIWENTVEYKHEIKVQEHIEKYSQCMPAFEPAYTRRTLSNVMREDLERLKNPDNENSRLVSLFVDRFTESEQEGIARPFAFAFEGAMQPLVDGESYRPEHVARQAALAEALETYFPITVKEEVTVEAEQPQETWAGFLDEYLTNEYTRGKVHALWAESP